MNTEAYKDLKKQYKIFSLCISFTKKNQCIHNQTLHVAGSEFLSFIVMILC